MKSFYSTLRLLAIILLTVSQYSYGQTTIIFDTPGSGTWTVPCGVTSVTVELYGGGGGGGGANSNGQAGGGGGGGGYTAWTFAVVPSSTYAYTVGAGGNGGSPPGNGQNGQQSTWNGGTLFAKGGNGGLCENNGGTGGAGGVASGWAMSITGENGFNGGSNNGGDGGQNYGPNGGAGGIGGTPGNNGNDGLPYGGGGAGGGDRYWGSNTSGGAGADGAVILTFNSTVTQPNAGADINACLGSYSLSGNTPDPGWTGTWSVQSGPASVTSPNNPNSAVTGLGPGDCSVIRWTFTFPGCPNAYDEVTICYPAICNDECSGAVPFVVDGGCVNGTNVGATPEGLVPSCFGGGDYNNSVWYSFVATDDSITVTFTAGTLAQASIAVYSDCPATTEVGCGDNVEQLPLTGLTVGNTYYVLLDGNGSQTGDFCISAFETLPDIGSTCATARELYVADDCTKSSGCAGTNQNNYLQGNTQDDGLAWETISPGDYGCSGNDLGQDAYWVTFNSENNTTLDFNNNGPAGNGLDYTLFTGGCGSLVEESCTIVPASSTQAVSVTPNTQYMVLITPAYSSTPPMAYLCITGTDLYSPPNDDCVNATPISSGYNYSITNSNATVDLDNTLCAGTTENNVWVYWTAEFSGQAFVNLQNQDCIENNGMQMSIFNADNNCPTSGSTCILYINPAADGNFFGQFTAVMGETYYIQLDGYCGTGCTFDFCITSSGGANCSTLAALPVELTTFTGEFRKRFVDLNWETQTEFNNDYFILDRSIDGIGWESIRTIDGAGNSMTPLHYNLRDYDVEASGVYYYRLTQVDYDGKRKGYLPIAVNVEGDDMKEIVKIVNTMGQEVTAEYTGIKIIVYSDGSSKKVVGIGQQ